MGQRPGNVVLFESLNRVNRDQCYNAPYHLNVFRAVGKESTRNARQVRYISNVSTWQLYQKLGHKTMGAQH